MNKTHFKQPDVPDFIQKIFLTQKHFQKIPSGFDSEKIPNVDNIISGFDSSVDTIPSVDSEPHSHMLTKDVFRSIVAKLNYNSPLVKESIIVQEQQPTKKPDFLIPQKRNTRFSPQFNDSIFWCMYVHTYG